VANLERFVRITFGGAANVVDAAVGWAVPSAVRREIVFLNGGVRQYFRAGTSLRPAVVGMQVGKSGRTTQLTHGRITDIAATIRVSFGGGRVATFVDQIAIQSLNRSDFSAGGDSGSLIWTLDEERSPVALLFAGGNGTTFANHIDDVLDALDVDLYT
jgi:hypothetical protein